MTDEEVNKKIEALLSAVIALRSGQEKRDAAIDRQFALFARRMQRIENRLELGNGALWAEPAAPRQSKTLESATTQMFREGLLVPGQLEDSPDKSDVAEDPHKRPRGRPRKATSARTAHAPQEAR